MSEVALDEVGRRDVVARIRTMLTDPAVRDATLLMAQRALLRDIIEALPPEQQEPKP